MADGKRLVGRTGLLGVAVPCQSRLSPFNVPAYLLPVSSVQVHPDSDHSMIGFLKRISLTWWIIIAMVIGVIIGWADHAVWPDTDLAANLKPLSTIFLRMIKSIVVPLIFASLVIGIAGHGDDLKRVGRLALRVDRLLRDRHHARAGRRPGGGAT